METANTQLHNERDNTKLYTITDHRVVPEKCVHSRFMDIAFPKPFGRCLDCGSEIQYGTWVLTDGASLSDAELVAERKRYNELWGEVMFGNAWQESATAALQDGETDQLRLAQIGLDAALKVIGDDLLI